MSYKLVPEWQVGDIILTDYPFSVDRDSTVDIGEPEVVVDIIPGMLADGDIEQERRSGNRTYGLTVYVEGADLAEVATNEAALRSELRRSGLTLSHTPGDDFSPTSVYEVLVARMKVERQDPHESHMIRKVTLTLTCSPFARSADLTTVEALSVAETPSTVLVDECNSTTGWTTPAGDDLTLVTVSGNTGVQAADGVGASGDGTVSLTRAAAIDMSAHPYLVLEWGLYPGSSVTLRDGTTIISELSREQQPGGWSKSTFGPVDPTAFAAGFQLTHVGGSTSELESIAVLKVEKSNVPPNTTPRQLSRIVEPGGTERTPGSIHVQTATGTGSLGLTIVHTSPEDGSGYSPPLRRWRTVASTGPETVDATALSGKTEPIGFFGGGFYAEVPTSALPEGGYVLMARMCSLAAQTKILYWSASTIFPDDVTQQGYVSGSFPFVFPDTNWHLIPVAALSLPSVRTSAGRVQILLQAESGGVAQVELDEGWLFRSDDDCALTIVETDRPHLWLDSADTSSSVPRVWVGDGDTTRVHPGEGLMAMGAHVLHPDGTAIATSALTDYAAADASFYRRWHSNAAE